MMVRLERQPDGLWRPVSAAFAPALPTPPNSEQVDLQGIVAYVPASGDAVTVRVSYGVERFYLPEGDGKQIEQDMRERPFFVKLAVAADGSAQIKQFLDGDMLLYDEPAY